MITALIIAAIIKLISGSWKSLRKTDRHIAITESETIDN